MNLLTTLRQGVIVITGGISEAAGRVIDREKALAQAEARAQLLEEALTHQIAENAALLAAAARREAAQRASP